VRVVDLLRTIDLFEGLSTAELGDLTHRLCDRRLQPGEVLCDTDKPNDSMFLVIDGAIHLDGSAGRLSDGEWFGEMNLITRGSAPCTATAVVHSHVLELQKADFEAFVMERPQRRRTILAALSRRAAHANQRLLTHDPGDAPGVTDSRVYAVFSPRGGSGKTMLAVQLALRLAELNPQPVALLDLDLLFDAAALQLDVTPATSLGASAESRPVGGAIAEHAGGLKVVVAATSPEEGERVTGAHIRAALAGLRRQCSVTVVDCGTGLSEPTLAALETADRLLCVCTPELSTLRDMRECQQLFGQALHLDKNRIAYVFNHPLPALGLTRRQFEDALEVRMLTEIKYGDKSAIDQLAGELNPVRRSNGR
jgi:MinD superfamily P-loop ATPase